MKQFILELFLTIKGIGAMSGIHYTDDHLYLVADNSNYLYEYNLKSEELQKNILLIEKPGENIAKSEKQDFEALASDGKSFFLFGSGSKDNRNLVVKYNPTNRQTKELDYSSLYDSLRDKYHVNKSNFNIEGAVFIHKEWWLFNRGNGDQHQNGIFQLNGAELLGFTTVDLPKIQGVQSGFTDAVRVGDKIYFLAAAEDENSNYHDGEIKGSLVGRLDIATKKVDFTQIISLTHKFEGITVYKNLEDQIQFLLCEDGDAVYSESEIYKLTIHK